MRLIGAARFAVKSGAPDEAVSRLDGAINKALGNPKVHEALGRVGAEPAGGTPTDYGQLAKSRVAHWGQGGEGIGHQDGTMTEANGFTVTLPRHRMRSRCPGTSAVASPRTPLRTFNPAHATRPDGIHRRA
jgi:hypothetical protein